MQQAIAGIDQINRAWMGDYQVEGFGGLIVGPSGSTEASLSKLGAAFYKMNDDALAETAEDMQIEGRRLLRMAGMAAHELLKRREERGATVLDTDHWGGKLTPGAPYHDYDDERMERLKPLLTDKEWTTVRVQAAPPPPR